ncbi:hypothetical protein [Candidatus Uabimicrobium sp. HlEnr_7]|uniref:hypothetical protein n=1 Tax=Candidatus Uabimicrobium helgolandensis TaxID=3095367 RepID=UPI003556A579
MKKKLICILLVVTICGCGTYLNLQSDQAQKVLGIEGLPYGGVMYDFTFMVIAYPFGILLLVDVPFTLIGDTLTLPYILYAKPYCTNPPQNKSQNKF